MAPRSAIIGSSTGIGRALAELHREQNLKCILFSRTPDKLQGFVSFQLDLTKAHEVEKTIGTALQQHPQIETIFIISGTGDVETEPSIETAHATIALNCEGFTRAAYASLKYLEGRGSGSLVAVTSVAAVRGGSQSLSYNASKAYQSSLLEGLRCRVTKRRLPITITEIRAGFVDTAMMKADKPFWIASPQQAARAIMEASRRRKDLVYVLVRWRIVGWILSLLPTWIYKHIG